MANEWLSLHVTSLSSEKIWGKATFWSATRLAGIEFGNQGYLDVTLGLEAAALEGLHGWFWACRRVLALRQAFFSGIQRGSASAASQEAAVKLSDDLKRILQQRADGPVLVTQHPVSAAQGLRAAAVGARGS